MPQAPSRPANPGLDAAAARQFQLTKPLGSLGALEQVVLDLASIQNAERPMARPAAAVIFAADHPVVRHGVAIYPASVTAGMVVNFARGGAAAAVAADWVHGLPLQVHDVGVDTAYDIPPNGSSAEVFRHRFNGLAAGDLRVEDAMSPELFEAAVEAGRLAVVNLEPRPKVLILGEMGIGNAMPASAVSAALLGRPAEEFVGLGAGVDGEGLRRRQQVIDDALARLGSTEDPLELSLIHI